MVGEMMGGCGQIIGNQPGSYRISSRVKLSFLGSEEALARVLIWPTPGLEWLPIFPTKQQACKHAICTSSHTYIQLDTVATCDTAIPLPNLLPLLCPCATVRSWKLVFCLMYCAC